MTSIENVNQTTLFFLPMLFAHNDKGTHYMIQYLYTGGVEKC